MEENKPLEEEIVENTEQVETVEEEVSAEEIESVNEESDKASEYLERLQRLMAEFDNYRKRSEKERESLYDLGVSGTVTELLPIVDNFERALQQESEDKQFVEGVMMIHKQLQAMFEKLGVKPIEAEGQPFDPELHSAIMQVEDDTLGESVVAKEHQKGYMYKDKVIRYSMVTVAN